jgi:hypothetical protein
VIQAIKALHLPVAAVLVAGIRVYGLGPLRDHARGGSAYIPCDGGGQPLMRRPPPFPG